MSDKPQRTLRIVDVRISELRKNTLFPKKHYARLVEYLSPHLGEKQVHNAFGGQPMKEDKLLEVIEAVEFLLETRKMRDIKRAEMLEAQAKALREGGVAI